MNNNMSNDESAGNGVWLAVAVVLSLGIPFIWALAGILR